jgi:hypothetical protein
MKEAKVGGRASLRRRVRVKSGLRRLVRIGVREIERYVSRIEEVVRRRNWGIGTGRFVCVPVWELWWLFWRPLWRCVD